MELKASIEWQDRLAFTARLDGHEFTMDTSREAGGEDRGPRPKGLLLAALAGCTGMDVVSMLKKMKVNVQRLVIETDAKVADTHPKKVTAIAVRYLFFGDGLPAESIRRAVELSETKYCGVGATLKPGVAIHSQIFINDEPLPA